MIRAASLCSLVVLCALGAVGWPPAGEAGVLDEARASLTQQLYACMHIENTLFFAAQDPQLDPLQRRQILGTAVDCLRELGSDLDHTTAAALGLSDLHYRDAGKNLAKALRLEEKELARVDKKIATGKAIPGLPGGAFRAINYKARVRSALADLTSGKPLPPLEPDFEVADDVIDDPNPPPPVVPLADTNALEWRPEGVGKHPDKTAGWTVNLHDGKIAVRNFKFSDGTKRKIFTYQGTSKTTTGTASFTTDDVLTPPFFLQGTGGLYSLKEKDRAAALGARVCLSLDREPQTDPAQFYVVCTNHQLTPRGTQVFDFTDQGLAGGNVFFPDESLISMRITLADDTIHTEVQPRGNALARVILQNNLALPSSWPGARAGFGATQLAKHATLGIEHVTAWSDPFPFVVPLEATNLLAQPDDAAAVVGALDPFRPSAPISVSADGAFLEIDTQPVTAWVHRSAVLPVNTQNLPIGPIGN